MKEHYCTYSQAVKLKELGFDWEVKHSYSDVIKESAREEWDEEECQWSTVYDINSYPKPRLDQVQKWLREKGIIVWISPEFYEGDALEDVKWYFYTQPLQNLRKQRGGKVECKYYTTYELALSAGIDAALELLTDNTK